MTNHEPKHPPADMAGLDGLIDELSALYVWPQSVADTYADTLTPRQIEKLYEVGTVAAKATTQLQALAARVKVLEAENERLREALGWIAKWCEEEEKLEYNDAMRKAFQRNMGQAARAALGDSHD